MNICKRALTIALRHPLYLIIYICFLSAIGVLLMGEVGGTQDTAVSTSSTSASSASSSSTTTAPAGSQVSIALVDRDNSAVSRALRAALATTDELVDVDDEPIVLQDVLAKDQADIVLIIPAGFGEQLIDAARTDQNLPQLNMATGSDMQSAALASQRASRWSSLVAAQAALNPALDTGGVVAAVEQSANVEPSVQVLTATPGNTAASRLAFYLTFSSYTVTSSIVVIAGVVLATLNAPNVRRRQLSSPVSTWRLGLGSIAGCAVLALAVCAWVSAIGIVTAGAAPLLSHALPQVALALAALVTFALVPLALAYTLAQCGFQEDALNAIANLGGMVMSFLGGAWVPLSLMGPGVQAVARFTPTYWMYNAITEALGARAVTLDVLATVASCLGIIVLFAAAIASAGLVAARLRVREA